jgi:hypothetical protein
MLNQGRSSRLTQAKIKKLNDVGFVWEAGTYIQMLDDRCGSAL